MCEKPVYERVYLIGVDGAGNFFRSASTPSIDRIFQNGSVNHFVKTATPTISAQCWGSLIFGVSPYNHRLTNGIIHDTELPSDYPYPSIFSVIRKHYPNAVLASICNWNAINVGMIEPGIDIVKQTGNDDEVCEYVCNLIEKKDPKFLFVHMDGVDEAGHANGYGTKKYLESIEHVDGLIGKIYDTALRCETIEKTLFIVTADHGGTPVGSHGGSTPAEMDVSFYVSGKTVIPGNFGDMEIKDTPSILAYAFGIEQPSVWSSRIPDNMFYNVSVKERPNEISLYGMKKENETRPTPVGSGCSIQDFTDTSTIMCMFPFDESNKDIMGKLDSIQEGKLYYVNGIYGNAAVFDDAVIHCQPLLFGTGSFTFCSWLRIPNLSSEKEMKIFSTMENDQDPGFSILIHNHNLIIKVGFGNFVSCVEVPIPETFEDTWVHLICSHCPENHHEVCTYFDFRLSADEYLKEYDHLPNDFHLDGHGVSIGGYSTLMMDDLIVFDHKLSDDEIDNLQKYYEQ